MQKRMWSAAVLKWIAIITMTIDHIGAAAIEKWRSADGRPVIWRSEMLMQADILLREIGRIAFPIFCFLLVEGFIHTHSRRQYAVRLLIFGIVSQIPFQLALYWGDRLRLNVMFTLLFGLLAIWAVDSLFHPDCKEEQRIVSGREEQKTVFVIEQRNVFSTGQFVLRTLAAVLIVLGLLAAAYAARSDYSWGGVLLILVLFLLRKYPVHAAVCGWLCITFYSWVQIGFDPRLPLEVYSFAGFALCLFYNGKRGTQSRYFFYIYYPAHLMVLWLIRTVLN